MTPSWTDNFISEPPESVHSFNRIPASYGVGKETEEFLRCRAVEVFREMFDHHKSVEEHSSFCSEVDEMDVELIPLLGGASNKLFVATHLLSATHIVMRVYGSGTENLIDRDFEIKLVEKIGRLGIGSKLLKSWDGGRAEEFLHGHSLKRLDFKNDDILENLGRCLGILHRLSDQDSEFQTLRDKSFDLPWTLKVSKQWGECAKNVQHGKFEDIVDQLLSEFDKVVRTMWKNFDSPIVLCHNDLNAGNILVYEGEEKQVEEMYFVDYEYAGFNYRSYDLGNFWCETFMNNHFSISPYFQAFPDDGLTQADKQKLFIRAYLSALKDIEKANIDDEEIERTITEMIAFSLGSHVVWGLWGLAQSEVTNVPFGFEAYGLKRIELFYMFLEKYQFLNSK